MKYFIIALLALVFSASLHSQDLLLVDENQPEAEFHVAINPLDSNNIVLGTIHGFGNESEGSNNLRIHYTKDFGQTWSTSEYTGEPEGYHGAGDPVLGFDLEGEVLLTNLSATVSGGELNVNTLLSQSIDGGESWELMSEVEKGFTDKPWLAIDISPSSSFKGNIYLPLVGESGIELYSIKSDFTEKSAQLLMVGDALPSVVVANDGTVFTSTLSIEEPNKIYVQEFKNGGKEFIHSTKVADFKDYTFGAPWISNRFQPTQYLAIDNSHGVYEGRLYLAYTASEDDSPNDFDVFLCYSDDNGLSWSIPRPVHSENQDRKQQFYSSIYVNDQGVLIMDWYDRKNYDVGSLETDFYMGVSYDGGESFIEVQLNGVSTDFSQIIATSNGFGIGEYHQVVATDNTAISFWSDGRKNDGDLNIYMAKVDIVKNHVGLKEVGVISQNILLSAPYPVPVKSKLFVDIELKKPYLIDIELVNNNGRKVWTQRGEQELYGSQVLEIPMDVISGTYYLKISSTKGFYKVMKVVKQ